MGRSHPATAWALGAAVLSHPLIPAASIFYLSDFLRGGGSRVAAGAEPPPRLIEALRPGASAPAEGCPAAAACAQLRRFGGPRWVQQAAPRRAALLSGAAALS